MEDLTRLWPQVERILDELLDLPEPERSLRIAAACAGDAALERGVRDVLRADGESSQFFETLTATLFDEDEGDIATPAPLPLERIGPFRIVRELGSGGMGTVLLGERDDGEFEQHVAIKLLHRELATGELRETLVRERRILARLEHPNIARMFDGGVTTTGEPYFIMEHVDGQRIDHYCDAGGLDLDARVRLFLDVLAAVAYAHTNLIVHRDLKPANVLVGKDGQVKLLDFGIAKLLEPESGEGLARTITRRGDTAFTPEYAAPEQLTGGAITTATDVYALGVLLYVLLAGRHPVGASTASPAAWIEAVLDGHVPRLSDAVVTTTSHGPEALVQNAARRGTSPKRLSRVLRGDLDNIVAKALKKEPPERYPSVEALADDLRRYLRHEPVRARGDSFAYRAARFARRNRGAIAAAGLVIAAILAGTAGIAWQSREARAQRDVARSELARATASGEFMGFLLSVGAPAGQKFSVADLLEQGEILIDKEFAEDDALRAEMLAAIGHQYILSQRWDRATPVLERAAEIVERSSDTALRARATCPLALLKILNGDRRSAEAMMARALADLPDDPQYTLQRAECLTRFSEFGFFTGEAEPMIRHATAALALLDRSPVASTSRRIDAQGALAYGYYLARRSGEADAAYAEIMKVLERVGRDRTVAAADTLNNWAVLHFLGDIARAEPLCRRTVELRRSIEGTDAITPFVTFNHAGVLLQLARYPEAEALYDETIRTATTRQEEVVRLDATMELAEVYIETGDLARAEAQLEKLTPFLASPRFDAHRQAQLAYHRGRLAQARGDHPAARALFESTIRIFDAEEWKIGMSVEALIGLAQSQEATGDGVAAAATAERALALAESFVEPEAPSHLVGRSLAALGDIRRSAGSHEGAREAFRRALQHLERTLGPDHPATVKARQSSSF